MASRREGQTTKDEVKQRDLEQELEEKERKHFSAKEREREIAGKFSSPLSIDSLLAMHPLDTIPALGRWRFTFQAWSSFAGTGFVSGRGW